MNGELNQQDKDTLVRAIAFYYENHIWKDFVNKDSSAASDEDYNLRKVVQKLELKLPDEIKYQL